MFDNSVQVLISECNFFGYVQPKNKILKTCEEEYQRFKEGALEAVPSGYREENVVSFGND